MTQLVQCVSEGVAVFQERPPDEAKNNARNTFTHRAYLKLLEIEGLLVDEYVVTVDSVRFQGLTVPAQER